MADEVLLFVTYKPKEKALAELRALFSSRTTKPLDLDVAAEMLRNHLDLKFKPVLRGMPSYDFVLAVDGVDETPPLTIDDTFVFALDTIDQHSREATELYRLVTTPRADLPVRDVQVGIDLPTGLADAEVWCPKEASFPLFGDLNLALMQMRAPVMGAHGQDVNVVIIDQGINKNVLGQRVPGAKFLGGWSTPEFGKGGPLPPPGPIPPPIPPGGWRDDGLGPKVTHGTKMASLVLAVASQARILDLALLPSRILSLQGFLSWAVAAYWMLAANIIWLRLHFPAFRGPWVLNNSWAVYNLSTDFPPGHIWNYGSNLNHPMNLAVAAAPLAGIDVVFAAGNCGQFCPDPRCGDGQIGPAHSIYGVAALKDVLTVAAVRADETWLGYSSQGPADLIFGSTKPDLCAPSQFAAVGDWNRSFTGTSSACALTAGAVAARRTLVSPGTQSPALLRGHAVATARKVVNQAGTDERRGAGMIHVGNFVV